MRFALLTENSDYRRMWSGTVNQMVAALREAGHGVEALDLPVLTITSATTGLAARIQRNTTGLDFGLDRTAFMARLKARAIRKQLAALKGVDALLVPVGSTILPSLRVPLPIVYVSDATLPLMIGYYERFAHFSPRTQRRAIDLERRAMRQVDLAVFPTHWAAASARDDLQTPQDRILVAPFGPNMADVPSRGTALATRKPGPFRVLFCAVEWKRKGGDIVLEMARDLARRGRKAEVTILGIRPPHGADIPDNVTVIPYLDKSDPAEAAIFAAQFRDADLFVMPTRAECFGMVFCEAAAFGTPSLTTATGGVGEAVRDGETGLLLPLEAGAGAYADAVEALMGDPARLDRLRQGARDDFEGRLNWTAWAAAVTERTAAVLKAPSRGPRSGK